MCCGDKRRWLFWRCRRPLVFGRHKNSKPRRPLPLHEAAMRRKKRCQKVAMPADETASEEDIIA
jgi:hypothetical protein